MRVLFLICVFLSTLAVGALAMREYIPQAEIDAINAQIGIAQGMDKNIRLAQTKYDEAVSRVETTEAGRLSLKAAWEREKSKQSAAFTVAIHMTIATYLLNPNNAAGTSVMRQTKGRAVVWLPVAGEGEDRKMQSAGGKLRDALKPSESFDGLTSSDGVTFITRAGFNNGANCLASNLFHERIHFELFTTDGKGNAMSRAEREEAALTAELENSKYFFDPVKDLTFINQIRTKLAKETAKVQAEKGLAGMIRRLLPSEKQPDMSESMTRTDTELADISALVAKARSQADISRRDREEREANALAAAAEASNREDDERLRDTFIALARQSCANPGSVTRTELESLPRPHQRYFYFTDPARGAFPAELRSDCLDVYRYMAEGGKDPEEVRRKSTPLRASDYPTAVAAQPLPPTATVAPPAPFSEVFPQLRDFAINACREPDRVNMGRILTQPYDFSYLAYDINLAREYAATLNGCPRDLFNRLIEMIRGGDWRRADRQWLRATVASYSQSPDVSPVYAPPPGGGRGKKCEDYGNINCP